MYVNFECAKELVDELVGVIRPGYIGIENAVGNNYGASYSYFQSQGWNDNNRETRITMARTYALSFYTQYQTLVNYVIQRGDVIAHVLYDNHTLNANVYNPHTTVTQVYSFLWIYEMDDGIVCVSVGGSVRHGSIEQYFVRVAFTVRQEIRIGINSGWIYTFTPVGGEPYVYDLRTVTYFYEL